MQTFLREVAQRLYGEYGDGISSLGVVFPNRRARLFFNDALSSIADRPLWQPRYLTMDDIMESVAGVRRSDTIPLVAELHKVYSRYHDEPFDRFYFWGEMLLADFDSIDKYMVDASSLLVNIADIARLHDDLSYLTEAQAAVLRTFRQNLGSGLSPEKQHFIRIWDSLPAIYADFRAHLDGLGMAYQGMVYRKAAERLLAGDFPGFEGEYAIVGFNALSESEKILFDRLQSGGKARFYWDYDNYYAADGDQEAGHFIRENTKRFPSEMEGVNSFEQRKDITVVASPSEAMQCKYVTRFLDELSASGRPPGKETAIVLTDEKLLLPLLHSIPESVERVNVTMGYPLRQSPAYTLVERMAELQRHKKERTAGTVFYHGDVAGILNHPYIQSIAPHKARELLDAITSRRQIYVHERSLREAAPVFERIFRSVEGWKELSEYIVSVLEAVGAELEPSGGEDMQREFLALVAEETYRLGNVLSESGAEVSRTVFLSLLRKVLQNMRIPYLGEPLAGVQVMGVLETRNLDFENVLILSAGDDTFPGNHTAWPSFIPHSLRLAYGLPTPQHREGVYAYYFYRLLQRAHRVDIVYCSKADEKKSGEPSRYIYQLDYESPHEVVHKTIGLDVSFTAKTDYTVEKQGAVWEKLSSFLGPDAVKPLSPSAFYAYVECPMKFYFRSIAGLREEDDLAEEVDLPMFGNIFHSAAELIYGGIKGRDGAGALLEEIRRSPQLAGLVEQAIRKEYFKGDTTVAGDDFGGNITLVKEIVQSYLRDCLLAWDASHGDFTVEGVEEWNELYIAVNTPQGAHEVRFGGKSDRIDSTGGALRIVDYKTGARHREFRGVEALFSPLLKDRNPAVLQIFLYCLMIGELTGRDIVPALYFIRFMNEADYSPTLVEVRGSEGSRTLERFEVTGFTPYREEFERSLKASLGTLFDTSIPFTRCSDITTCERCEFAEICRLK